jgi:hypothetical protein
VRIPDFEDLVEADEANGTNTALDALEALVDQDPREDDGRAALEPDEQEEYLRLGGKRLYTPEARAARQVEIAEQIRAGDVLEAIYHVDGRLANNREDQKAARDADSKARVSGWFS